MSPPNRIYRWLTWSLLYTPIGIHPWQHPGNFYLEVNKGTMGNCAICGIYFILLMTLIVTLVVIPCTFFKQTTGLTNTREGKLIYLMAIAPDPDSYRPWEPVAQNSPNPVFAVIPTIRSQIPDSTGVDIYCHYRRSKVPTQP